MATAARGIDSGIVQVTSGLRRVLRAALPKRFRFAARMALGGFTYNADGLATMHACDFAVDPKFRAAYSRGKATGSWDGQEIEFRAYVACWAATHARNLEGDFVECGVNRGGSALTVSEYASLADTGKRFFLIDTYSGLVDEYVSDEERLAVQGYVYPDCYECVVELFRDQAHMKIVRGVVPDVLATVDVQQVAYLHIDMNCAAPEIAAAEFFWPRLVRGGVLLLDDSGFARHAAQRSAFQDFAQRHGVPILGLPTGQGLLMKV